MTLTETAALTKKIFVFGVIFIILGGLTWAGINYYIAYQKAHTPPPEIKPDLAFGNLPKPNLPISLIKSSNHGYTLATKTGDLPADLPKILKVYFIPQLSTSLLAPDKAKTLASSFDFNSGPDILSPTEYRFLNSNGNQLIIDISSGNFRFERTIPADANLILDDGFTDSARVVSDFKSFLSTKNLLKDSLVSGKTQITYDKALAKDSGSASVSIWQSDIEDGDQKYPIVTPSYTEGLVKGIISKYNEESTKYLTLDYIYWDIDFTKFSTYPLKKIDQAFAELKNGSGIVVQDQANNQIPITSIYLAYFLSDEYSAYLQPVYVFAGDNFIAYVSAIDPTYLSKD